MGRYRQVTLIALLWAIGCMLSGCAQLRQAGNQAVDIAMIVPETYNAFMLMPESFQANRNFKQQKYGLAVAGYSRLYRAHPWHWRKRYYLLQHGRSLYLMQDYLDAKIIYDKFEDAYPDNKYSDQVHAYQTKISAIRAADQRFNAEKLARARGDVEALKQLIDEQPDKARLHYELGNAYWRLKEYGQAADAYLTATELDAALSENALIQNRLFINEEGKVEALDPAKREFFEKQRNPLVVFETHEYRMNRRAIGAGDRSFMFVTGKVRNQSDRVLYNVRVITRFKNLRGDVMDVEDYRIGTMGPGEVRAFIARGSQGSDDFYLLTYECSAVHW